MRTKKNIDKDFGLWMMYKIEKKKKEKVKKMNTSAVCYADFFFFIGVKLSLGTCF